MIVRIYPAVVTVLLALGAGMATGTFMTDRHWEDHKEQRPSIVNLRPVIAAEDADAEAAVSLPNPKIPWEILEKIHFDVFDGSKLTPIAKRLLQLDRKTSRGIERAYAARERSLEQLNVHLESQVTLTTESDLETIWEIPVDSEAANRINANWKEALERYVDVETADRIHRSLPGPAWGNRNRLELRGGQVVWERATEIDGNLYDVSRRSGDAGVLSETLRRVFGPDFDARLERHRKAVAEENRRRKSLQKKDLESREEWEKSRMLF
ncbi:MAG: hypothetical protein R3F19_28335 [Verrucomicrobiales bacterium]